MRFSWFGALLLVLGSGLCARLEAQVSPGPLARAHQDLEGALKCTRCHGGGGKEAMQSRCVACHRDVGWLAERERGLHGSAAVRGEKCSSCHPEHAGAEFLLIKWTEGSPERFDHRRTGWALEQSHAKLECEKCHTAAKRVSPAAALAEGGKSHWTGLEASCASCHEDIHRGALGERCAACHDAGRWKTTPGFSHDTTAYALTFRHAEITCDKCHLDPRFATRRDGRGRPVPVYKPLPHESCASCHKDVHDGRLGATCTTCHTTRGFKQVTGDGFDHARTRYALRGKHATVRCAACHQDFGTDQRRKPAFATCAGCHTDPHAGSATLLGKPTDCGSCHTENGFTPATFPLERHRASRYPLEGKHASVKCSGCHRKDQSPVGQVKWGTARVIIRPGFAKCLDCHADDHGGQLASRSGGADCAGCHKVDGFKPSSFDRAAHAKLRLAIEGRHGEIACQACHGADRKGLAPLKRPPQLGKVGFVFGGIEVECVACHLDPHKGRFEARGQRPAEKGCLACHDVKAFVPAATDVATHSRFRFALAGAHRATPCVACHKELERVRPRPAVSTLIAGGGRFAELRFETASTCADCHQTVHGPQFDGRKGGARCDACHTEDAFAPASRFDHDRDASFALKGGHQRVACKACHVADPAAPGSGRLVYRPLSGKCESCHAKKADQKR